MDEKQLAEAFDRLKQQLPVNQQLKNNLRVSFMERMKRRMWWRIGSYAGIAAAILTLSWVSSFSPEQMTNKVEAASLKIANQQSFVDLGWGPQNGVAEYKGTVYISVPNKGLFSYNTQGFKKIVDGDFEQVRVSEDGKKLLLTNPQGIQLYDLQLNQMKTLLANNDTNMGLNHATWKDTNHIFFVKTASGKTAEIFEYDIASGMETKISEGDYPSYAGRDHLVFVRDNQIVDLNLKDQTEKKVDEGNSPSVSPDHQYVAYVKTEYTQTNAEGNTFRMDNVWIADLDFSSKKQVTTNFPQNEYLPEVKYKPIYLGLYSYKEPTWSSQGDSLYLLKKLNGPEGPLPGQITKVDLTTQRLTAEETIGRFMQALTVRDEDYARGLMKTPPQYLTGSNPRCVGYSIISTGKEGGQEYVDANSYWSYNANPYYKVIKSRYYVSPNENGYIIDKVTELSTMEFNAFENQTVKLIQNGKKQTIFRQNEIPKTLTPDGRFRIASLAYHEASNTLIVTLQILRDQNQSSFVRILKYDMNTHAFSLLQDIKEHQHQPNVGIAFTTINSTGQVLSLDLYTENNKQAQHYTAIFDMETNKLVELGDLLKDTKMDTMRSDWWNGEEFIFEGESEGMRLKYKYNIKTQALQAW